MKDITLQTIFAAVCGAFMAYFNVLAVPLVVLFTVMIVDYATGMTEAYISGLLSSRTGIKGIIKKLGYFAMVVVGMVLDYLITSGLTQIGINIGITYCIGLIVAIWLIINELISILENLSEMGLPLPSFLVKLVKKLKISVESKADEGEE